MIKNNFSEVLDKLKNKRFWPQNYLSSLEFSYIVSMV